MWQRLSRREQLLLGAIVGIVLLYCYWTYAFLPLYQRFEDARLKLAMVQERFVKGQDVAGERRRWEVAVQKAQAELSRVSPRFSADLQDGAVLVEIGLEAVRQGVKVTHVRPAGVIRKDHYLELPLEFTVTGDYPKVLEFIKRLENLPNLSEIRRMRMVSLALTENPGASAAAADGRVKADFTLVLYGSPAPETKWELEELGKWVVGRYNAYQAAGGTAPAAAVGE